MMWTGSSSFRAGPIQRRNVGDKRSADNRDDMDTRLRTLGSAPGRGFLPGWPVRTFGTVVTLVAIRAGTQGGAVAIRERWWPKSGDPVGRWLGLAHAECVTVTQEDQCQTASVITTCCRPLAGRHRTRN